MGGYYSLPQLRVQTPDTGASMLQMLGAANELKTAPLRQQILSAQAQGAGLQNQATQQEIQMRALQMKRDQAMADLFAGKTAQNQSSTDSGTGTDSSASTGSDSDSYDARTASGSASTGTGQEDILPGGARGSSSDFASAAQGGASSASPSAASTATGPRPPANAQLPGQQPTYQPPSENDILRVAGPYGLPLIKNMKDLQKTNADLVKTQSDHQAAALDYMGNLGAAIKSGGYNMDTARTLLQHAAVNEDGTPSPFANQIASLWMQIRQNPAQLQTLTDQAIAMSPKQRELAAQEQTAAGRASVIPGNQAKATQEQLALAAQTMGGATDPLSWTSRRNFLQGRIPDDLMKQIPQQYSPEAAQTVASLQKQPAQTPEMMGMKAWLAKNPGKDAADFLAWQKTIAPAFRLQMNGGQSDARTDRSYQYNNSELDKLSTPIEQTVQRLGRLQDTLAQGTPQADALVAPELLTVMAGGQGSGLRMNEAEISRIVGGRSNWQSLQAWVNKWKVDPSKANSIPPAQHQQIQDLLTAVQSKLNDKAGVIDQARQDLVNADNVQQHRQIVANARTKLLGVDQRGTSAGNGNVQVTDPRGVVHTFPDQASANAFKREAGIQ